MRGLRDRIRSKFNASVAEVGYRDKWQRAVLAVCLVGGLGSWGGTILASFLLGFAQYLTAAFGKPHYQMVVMLLAIVLILVTKPSGLFGKHKQLEERV